MRRIAVALAETLTALGEADAALALRQQVTESHSYPRAKVQLAELYLARNQPDLARAQVTEVLADDARGPAYQRKRDRVWVRRARACSASSAEPTTHAGKVENGRAPFAGMELAGWPRV